MGSDEQLRHPGCWTVRNGGNSGMQGGDEREGEGAKFRKFHFAHSLI